MRTVLAVVAAAVIVGLATVPGDAHHAFSAEFDANRPLHLEGVVTRMEWINPHAWVHLDVTNEDGSVTSWMVEGGTPNTLLRRGFNRESLLPGTFIIVDGYQAKDGSNKGNGTAASCSWVRRAPAPRATAPTPPSPNSRRAARQLRKGPGAQHSGLFVCTGRLRVSPCIAWRRAPRL